MGVSVTADKGEPSGWRLSVEHAAELPRSALSFASQRPPHSARRSLLRWLRLRYIVSQAPISNRSLREISSTLKHSPSRCQSLQSLEVAVEVILEAGALESVWTMMSSLQGYGSHVKVCLRRLFSTMLARESSEITSDQLCQNCATRQYQATCRAPLRRSRRHLCLGTTGLACQNAGWIRGTALQASQAAAVSEFDHDRTVNDGRCARAPVSHLQRSVP